MMNDAIRAFASQFAYKPVVENAGKLRTYSRFIVLGMGGSNLATELLKIRDPHLDISAHRTYGLPHLSAAAKKQTLFIASSYSGNTEETIHGFEEARKEGLQLAVIATGGTLLELAKRHRVPYVQVPKTGIQPRSALGFAILALAALLRRNDLVKELSALSKSLKSSALEKKGRALAKKLSGRVPVIYASVENAPIAYNWKIKFNETGKIPAFANSFPELNHNEMTGYDVAKSTKRLSERFFFIFLKDATHPKILKRMETTARLYRARGLPVEMLPLSGKSVFERVFNALLLADWAAFYTAQQYKVEAQEVPMVEEFKRLIK